VLPPGDTRICNGNSAIQSNHLLTATAAQNYGSNTYRIRQPFDFANRTGSIVFDADGTATSLLGWIAIAVTEDPIPSPSFSAIPGSGNFEGGVIPKNGISVELQGTCNTGQARVTMIHEYRNYVDYIHNFNEGQSTCFPTSHHHLNRFELRLSQSRVELWATPYSDNGVTFGNPTLVASANLGLTFSRGYVHLVTRNHASLKYWTSNDPADAREAWVVRWDNVGFDGPVINNTKEFDCGKHGIGLLAVRLPDSTEDIRHHQGRDQCGRSEPGEACHEHPLFRQLHEHESADVGTDVPAQRQGMAHL
jgi:hypothetical protein